MSVSSNIALRAKRAVLLLAAMALVLTWLVAAGHWSQAHACDGDGHEQTSCPLCLHWAQFAVWFGETWQAPEPSPAEPASVVCCSDRPVPTRHVPDGRAPPAAVS